MAEARQRRWFETEIGHGQIQKNTLVYGDSDSWP